jgi:hypothetical protein
MFISHKNVVGGGGEQFFPIAVVVENEYLRVELVVEYMPEVPVGGECDGRTKLKFLLDG